MANSIFDDFFRNRRRFLETLDGLEDELRYLGENNFFEKFELMTDSIQDMVELMKELNASIQQFNTSIQQISANTESISTLEDRLSIRGLIISTAKDFFYFLRQIINIAIVRNWRYLDGLARGRGRDKAEPVDPELLQPDPGSEKTGP